MATEISRISSKEYIFYSIYAFLLMFAPPIIPHINIVFFLAFFSLIYIILRLNKVINEVIFKARIVNFMVGYFIFYVYALLVFSFNGAQNTKMFSVTISDMYRYTLLVPAMFVCVLFLMTNLYKKDWNFMQISSILIGGGIIQFFFCLTAFLLPSIKTMFISVMAANTGQSVYFSNSINVVGTEIRYFGFASTLLDSFGYCVGTLTALALFLGVFYKSKYLFAVPCLLFTTALNSRTGLLIALIGAIFVILAVAYMGDIKKILTVIVGIIAFLICGYVILNIISSVSVLTMEWISSGFESLTSILTGKQTQTYDFANVLFSTRFWTLPKDMALFFGSGYDVNTTLNGILGFHSDVGYINLLWEFGIVGTILLLLPYLELMISTFIRARKKNKLFVLGVIVCFFIVMVKFDATSYTPGAPLFFVILWYSQLEVEGSHAEIKYNCANI